MPSTSKYYFDDNLFCQLHDTEIWVKAMEKHLNGWSAHHQMSSDIWFSITKTLQIKQ